MPQSPRVRAYTRRSVLTLAAGLAALPVLAACGQAAPPTNTAAPAKPAEAPKPAAPPEPTKPAAAAPAAEPTKPAAAAPAPTTAPAAAPTAAPAAPATAAPAAAAKPSSSIKINGNLQIIQSRSFNPIQTTFQHNLLIREAANRGWPLDKTYIEGFTSGT